MTKTSSESVQKPLGKGSWSVVECAQLKLNSTTIVLHLLSIEVPVPSAVWPLTSKGYIIVFVLVFICIYIYVFD